MRVALHTLGCKLNLSETSSIGHGLVQNGHTLVSLTDPADVIVVNTCSVTESADAECEKIIRRGRRASPDARVIVTGCHAQLHPERVASIEGVDAVVGTEKKHEIPTLVANITSFGGPVVLVDEIDKTTEFRPTRTYQTTSQTRVFFKIQDGCNYTCSFCTIPMARGTARAMALADIEAELLAIAKEGYPEVVLSGINLGEYRGSNDERFIDVLRLIDSASRPFRVRISSIEPNTLTGAVIEHIAQSPHIVPHLHVPLQSGSDHILRGMRRRYNTGMYASTIHLVHQLMPDAAIGIDVITGFPGETESRFHETLDFLQSLPFSYLHVFTYSERPGTPASAYEGAVPIVERRHRTRVLRALSEQRTREFHERMVGTQRMFIPEGYNAQLGTWSGWTENHISCELPAPSTLLKKPYTVVCHQVSGEVVRVQPLEELVLNRNILPILSTPVTT